MHPFTLTLKNYRGISDSDPLVVDVREGFTALVGPNNSGKSTLLRFFYEMRPLLEGLSNVINLNTIVGGGVIGASYPGVEDQLELIHNQNNRPITIEIEFPASEQLQISRICLTSDKDSPANWRGELYCAPGFTKLTAPAPSQLPPDSAGFADETGKARPVDLKPLINMCDVVRDSFYVAAFRNAITEGSGSYYDLGIGTSFINSWNDWKTGKSRLSNIKAQTVENDLAHIFGYERLEINAADGNTTLQVRVNGKPYRLRELGSGLAQFLVVLGNAAIRRPKYVLIDEPELNLHPSLQADFLTSLASYGSEGIMFATHSLGLARSVGDRIYSFQEHEGHTLVRPLEATPRLAEFVGEMSFSAYREMGYNTLLLVEGVTEVKAVRQFLRALGKGHKAVMVSLGGGQLIRGGVEVELEELSRLSDHIAVLIDSEREAPDAPLAQQRQTFVDQCTALGFHVSVTERRAFENYLTESAVQKVMGDKYRALEPYEKFEGEVAWGKHNNWRIAREMTKEEILSTDVGDFLNKLIF